MKKIFLSLLICLIAILAKAQTSGGFPGTGSVSNKQSLYHAAGGLVGDSGIQVCPIGYVDTLSANSSYISHYPGAFIRTTDNRLWMRNNTASRWIEKGVSLSLPNTEVAFGTGSGITSNSNFTFDPINGGVVLQGFPLGKGYMFIGHDGNQGLTFTPNEGFGTGNTTLNADSALFLLSLKDVSIVGNSDVSITANGSSLGGHYVKIKANVANTSGLQLTQLTSSSPTSTGQAIGVDATGHVVTITGGGGGVSLPSNQVGFGTGTGITSDANFTFNPTGNTNINAYSGLTLSTGNGGTSFDMNLISSAAIILHADSQQVRMEDNTGNYFTLNGNSANGMTANLTTGSKFNINNQTATNLSGLRFFNFDSSTATSIGQPLGITSAGDVVTIDVGASINTLYTGDGVVNDASGTRNIYKGTASQISIHGIEFTGIDTTFGNTTYDFNSVGSQANYTFNSIYGNSGVSIHTDTTNNTVVISSNAPNDGQLIERLSYNINQGSSFEIYDGIGGIITRIGSTDNISLYPNGTTNLIVNNNQDVSITTTAGFSAAINSGGSADINGTTDVTITANASGSVGGFLTLQGASGNTTSYDDAGNVSTLSKTFSVTGTDAATVTASIVQASGGSNNVLTLSRAGFGIFTTFDNAGNENTSSYTQPVFNSSMVTTNGSGKFIAAIAGIDYSSPSNTPTIVSENCLSGQTSPQTIVTYTTGSADSSYTVSAQTTITALSVNVVNTTVNYTDETNNSRTLTFFPMGATSATLSVGASNYAVMGEIRVKANTTITVSVTATGIGSETYNACASITKLHN